VSEDQELIPIEQHTEDGEQLTQSGLEESEATSERALVPLQVSQVDFYGDELMVVLVEIGGERQVLVPLRQFCQYLGVDWSGQYRHVMHDDVLSTEVVSVAIATVIVPMRGRKRSYSTLCLPLDLLPGWLFGLTPSRVKPSLAPRLHRYRKECFRMLWQAFQQGSLWRTTQETDSSEEEIYSWLTRIGDRVWQARERAIQANLPATLTVEQWLRTLEHFKWKCAYCEQRLGIIIEHFIPLPLAGTTADNCVPSCYACNARKGNVHPSLVTSISRQVLDTIQSYLCSIS